MLRWSLLALFATARAVSAQYAADEINDTNESFFASPQVAKLSSDSIQSFSSPSSSLPPLGSTFDASSSTSAAPVHFAFMATTHNEEPPAYLSMITSSNPLPVTELIASVNARNSSHRFTAQQAEGTVFTMQRLCAAAPWTARIQPALLQQKNMITYRNWRTRTTASQKKGFWIFYDGSLARRNATTGALTIENDVWASGDKGATWDLIAGRSLYGTSGVATADNVISFTPRVASSNCEDPTTDLIWSIGGYVRAANSFNMNSNFVEFSPDGLQWWYYVSPNFEGRYFSSCDVDNSGHVYSIGGLSWNPNGVGNFLRNDVWSQEGATWSPQTLAAPFTPRAEHITLIANNKHLGRNIMYVMSGGSNADFTRNLNDVWATSDSGITWRLICERAPWQPRWGAGAVLTKDGVIVVLGGLNTDTGQANRMYTIRDVWASFDGGAQWHACNLPSYEQSDWIRGEQGISLSEDGELLIASGYSYCPVGQCPQVRYDYRDVWKSDWSLDNTAELARRCGGASAVPSRGIGLLLWPNAVVNPRSLFMMNAMSHNAPWSARIQPALLSMSKPIVYKQVSTGLTVATPPNWLLLYEGALARRVSAGVWTVENDVYASADDGVTWDLISGITLDAFVNGISINGYQESSMPRSSFQSRSGSTNCENPETDDVYSIAGTLRNSLDQRVYTNAVWYSSDALTWVERKGRSFSPGRLFSSCDVDDHGRIVVIGGVTQRTPTGIFSLLNDVWMSEDMGVTFTHTGQAEFSPRAEHQLLHTHSAKLRKDLLYVIGGWTRYDEANNVFGTINDVWVSSDFGASWLEIAATPRFGPRWGHSGVITGNGIMLIAGGSHSTTGRPQDYVSYKDLYVSMNGGSLWHSCRLPAAVEYIRTEQAAQLTSDERLILASGYSHRLGNQRRSYSDVYVSERAVSDIEWLIQVCVGINIDNSTKVGLQAWPGSDAVPEVIEKATNGTTIALAILATIAVLAIVGYCFYQRKQNGSFPCIGGSSNPAEEAPQTDFSAFTFGGEEATK